jgi:hypothetical protein
MWADAACSFTNWVFDRIIRPRDETVSTSGIPLWEWRFLSPAQCSFLISFMLGLSDRIDYE